MCVSIIFMMCGRGYGWFEVIAYDFLTYISYGVMPGMDKLCEMVLW